MIRRLRSLSGLPLADLVGEAERALGLDIEVLSRPGYTPAAARAHLDAFADVAAGFTASADRPNLAGFLSWLEAALREERGLDKGYIEASPDAVQILTIHAAKGLEWDAVAVPGLVEGSFPALNYSKATHNGTDWVVADAKDRGWCGGLSGVPYDLRGDRDGLPVWQWRSAEDWTDIEARTGEFIRAGGEHGIVEERRLAYVAFTRARSDMLLSAPVWAGPGTPRVTSRFLTRGRRRARAGRRNASPGPTCRTRTCPSPSRTPATQRRSRCTGPQAPRRTEDLARAAEAVRMATDRQGQDGRVPTHGPTRGCSPCRVRSRPCTRRWPAARRARPPAGTPTGGCRRPAAPVHLGRRVAGPGPGRLRIRAAPADAAGARAGGSPRDRLPRLGRAALCPGGDGRHPRPAWQRRRGPRRGCRAARDEGALPGQRVGAPDAGRDRDRGGDRHRRDGCSGPDRRGLPPRRWRLHDRRLEDRRPAERGDRARRVRSSSRHTAWPSPGCGASSSGTSTRRSTTRAPARRSGPSCPDEAGLAEVLGSIPD